MRQSINRMMLSIFWVFIFAASSRGQLVTAQNENQLNDVLSKIQEADNTLSAIYDLDVFAYYDLETSYDSNLKKEVFKKTSEYKEKLSELKEKKAELLTTDYYVKIEKPIDERGYDVKRKGFNIILGYFGEERAPKSYNRILFTPLPTKNCPFEVDPSFYDERFFLKMNEENGLEIENDRENVKVYLIFRISGKQKVHFKYLASGDWYSVQDTFLSTKRVRVVVANDQTGKIYLDKTFVSK